MAMKNKPKSARQAKKPVESQTAPDVQQLPPERSPNCSVVGVGASAGGLEAFSEILANMPPDPGMALVLVQHLDPRHESLLTELLARATPMRVETALDGTVPKANHVYVMPANA